VLHAEEDRHPVRIRILSEDPQASLVDFFENRSIGVALRQVVSPGTCRQQEYLQAISEYDIVFSIGPPEPERPTSPWRWPPRRSSRNG